MKTVVLLVLAVVVLLVVLVTTTLFRNQARLFQPPGPAQRLAVYLTQHEAATSDNPVFEELRTPVFQVEADTLFETVLSTATDLGWQIVHSDDENLSAKMVVTTPLLHFKDDIEVQVKLVNRQFDGAASALLLKSSSRVGRADFAANAGHIQALVAAVDDRLRSASIRMFEAR